MTLSFAYNSGGPASQNNPYLGCAKTRKGSFWKAHVKIFRPRRV